VGVDPISELIAPDPRRACGPVRLGIPPDRVARATPIAP
jgi:hypothetical protein